MGDLPFPAGKIVRSWGKDFLAGLRRFPEENNLIGTRFMDFLAILGQNCSIIPL